LTIYFLKEKLCLVFCGFHQPNTRSKENDAQYAIDNKHFNILVCTTRGIDKQNSSINKGDYSQDGHYGSENSFNIHCEVILILKALLFF